MNNYAIIEDNLVVNIAVADLPLSNNWIPLNDIPVYIGDSYLDGDFYRNGEKIISYEEKLRNEN